MFASVCYGASTVYVLASQGTLCYAVWLLLVSVLLVPVPLSPSWCLRASSGVVAGFSAAGCGAFFTVVMRVYEQRRGCWFQRCWLLPLWQSWRLRASGGVVAGCSKHGIDALTPR